MLCCFHHPKNGPLTHQGCHVSRRSHILCVCPRWREGKFQEIIEAEYVLLEVNGLFTYKYSLTADSAHCSSQPQNWTTVMENASDKGPFAWDREVAVTLGLFLKQVTSQMVMTGGTQCVCLGAVSVCSGCYHRIPETGGL